MKDITDLKDKVCILTGGGGVIGGAIAEELARHRMKIAILDLNNEATTGLCEKLSKNYGIDALPVVCNVLDKDSLINAKEKVLERFGNIHFLINGAGGNSPKATTKNEFIEDSNLNELDQSFFGLNLDGFRQVFDLNFMGTLLPTMVFGEILAKNKNGVILNVSSMNAFRPLTKIPAYSAAKASINNFTEWLSVHFAKVNVRVNAIAPGFLLTNQNRFLLTDEKTGDLTPRGKKVIDGTPMGKFGDPDDITGTVLFLLSNMSSFITGITVPIDGGFNAYSGV